MINQKDTIPFPTIKTPNPIDKITHLTGKTPDHIDVLPDVAEVLPVVH